MTVCYIYFDSKNGKNCQDFDAFGGMPGAGAAESAATRVGHSKISEVWTVLAGMDASG